MNLLLKTGWLAGQAAGGLTYIWPVTLGMLLLLLGSIYLDHSKARLTFNRRLFFLLLPGLGTLLILLLGSVFEGQSKMAFLPFVGFGCVIVLAVISGKLLQPAVMTSVSVYLLLLWYSLWCCFVSIMSISGDWL